MGTINDLTFFAFLWQGFMLSDEKQKAGDTAIMYYGYVNKDKGFYIMEANTTNGTYRFYTGDAKKDYPTYWGTRESLTYERFYDVF